MHTVAARSSCDMAKTSPLHRYALCSVARRACANGATRAPQVALLVAKVCVVVGQVVEGAEVQVADLHHPRQPI